MSGLSDTLRDLAEAGESSNPAPPAREGSKAPQTGVNRAETDAEPDEDGELIAEVEAEDDDDDVVVDERLAAAANPTGAPAVRRPARRRQAQNTGLKEVGAPILITVGLLLCYPGFWALMILSGTWTSERPSAAGMAKVMLVCWPIAMALIAGGVMFFMQARDEKRRREAEQATRGRRR